ncbi:hypothetical protein QE152_g40310 [Popillia japonica]|uniref:Uncharacterized protein n=1 Tax=Popillia japonica TaxID=7064 RepID=A0AAW1HS78_POPJA
MNPSQFDEVLALVGPVLQKRSHREPLSPSQRLAITWRYLSEGDSLFSIASGYKVGRSTLSLVIEGTTEAIWNTLNKTVLKPLYVEDYKKNSQQMEPMEFAA